MPRIKFINLRPANAARDIVATTANDADNINLGTGPERLAPWWPLLESVLATANAQGQAWPGASADSHRQAMLLTEANINELLAQEWEDALAGADDSQNSSSGSVIIHHASAFCPRLIENGVLPPLQSKQPKNWRTLERMIRYEPSGLQCPSEEEYKCWLRRTSADPNPDTLIWEIYSLLDRFPTEKHYLTAIRKTFENVPHTAAFNAGVQSPQPDFVQGIDMAGFGDVRVEHIPGAVLFEQLNDSITLAHVSGDFFGPSSAEERFAETCSSHAGAALVFGRNSALKHLHRPDKEGHAHVLTFITNGSRITFYAHHASKKMGEDGKEKLEYHQWPLVTTSLKDSYANFRKGWAQLRNCQQYAFERSFELRDLLEKQHSLHGAACWAFQGKGGPRSPIKASQILEPQPASTPPKAKRARRVRAAHDCEDQGDQEYRKGDKGGEELAADGDDETSSKGKAASKRRAKRKTDDRIGKLTPDQKGVREERGAGKGDEEERGGQRPTVKKRKKRC